MLHHFGRGYFRRLTGKDAAADEACVGIIRKYLLEVDLLQRIGEIFQLVASADVANIVDLR